MDDENTPPDNLESTRILETESGPSQRIGKYRILQKLGEGGMGIVYLAEQEHPIRRRVALKIIKMGMDTRAVVARFEAERQVLALMNHPNVAKVFDAGTTEQGRPYFVMEYVKGVPINVHCDRQRLTTNERLEIFAEVCEGVQHAHQKAIIHRDLKPSNVLVTIQDEKSVPKIIDFGVAKAIEHRLTEQTLFTELGQIIGTPEYMSPEQAEMTSQDIDTRTDVYSLGVMLYELLVGALPFDSKELRRAGFDEIRRRIREEEPSRPSTRVGTLGDSLIDSAKSRRTDSNSLAKQLRGDLDWIAMKALEKDRTRRYGSPTELADDIRRHLEYQPVLAGPPSTVYRVGKFVRRHRLGVAVTAAVMVLVIGFAVRERIQSRQIAAERDRANRERVASDRVSEFLADMLGSVEPETSGIALWRDIRERVAEVQRGRGATEEQVEATLASLGEALSGVNATDAALRLLDEQVLAPAGETIEQELGQEPRIVGKLEHTLGNTYQRLGLYEPAQRYTLRAVETRRRVLGRDHPDTLSSMHNLAVLYLEQGRYDEAEKLHRETLEGQRRALGQDHPDTLSSMDLLTVLYLDQGRYDEADKLGRETLESWRRVRGDDHPGTLSSMDILGSVHWAQGRYDEAEELFRKALESRRRVMGQDHPDTLSSMGSLAELYLTQGRYAEADKLGRETLEGRRRALGQDHPDTLSSMGSLAFAYWGLGRYAEAEKLHRETLEFRRRVLGQDHPQTLESMIKLAVAYSSQGRHDDAEKLLREALETGRRVLGQDHPDTLWSMHLLTNVYRSQGRYAEAEILHFETVEARKRVLGDTHPDTLDSMHNLAWFLLTREPADSRDPQAALELALSVVEGTGYEMPGSLDTLSLAYHLTGDTAKAIENQKKAIALLPEGDSPLRTSLEEALAKFQAALKEGGGN